MQYQLKTARLNLQTSAALSSDEQQRWQSWMSDYFFPLLEKLLDQHYLNKADNHSCHIKKLVINLGQLQPTQNLDEKENLVWQQLKQQLYDSDKAQPASNDSFWEEYIHYLTHGAWPFYLHSTASVETVETWFSQGHNRYQRLAQRLPSFHHQSLDRLLLQHSSRFIQQLILAIKNGHPAAGPNDQQLAAATVLVERYRYLKSSYGNSDFSQKPPALDAAFKVLATTETRSKRPAKISAKLESRGLRKAHVNTDATEAGSELFVSEAGVVLLLSFLPAFFKKCAWLENGQFKSQNCQLAALFAVYYAATGKQAAEEPQLGLYKLLVDWPMHKPLPRSVINPPQVIAEAEKLLNAVVNHWTALKNTSVQGLRETFIQRQGKVLKENQQWLIYVEYKSVDVLLKQLPWSITVTQLPWLKYPILSNWAAR